MMRVLLKYQTIHQTNFMNQDCTFLPVHHTVHRIIIFMKRTFNKQIIVVYIQFQYIERIILAIKHAKRSKLLMK